MPYIHPNRRIELNQRSPITSGELNYVLTIAVKRFLGKNPDYERYNAVIGVLESVKLELYRVVIALYEDKKRQENGDVKWDC